MKEAESPAFPMPRSNYDGMFDVLSTGVRRSVRGDGADGSELDESGAEALAANGDEDAETSVFDRSGLQRAPTNDGDRSTLPSPSPNTETSVSFKQTLIGHGGAPVASEIAVVDARGNAAAIAVVDARGNASAIARAFDANTTIATPPPVFDAVPLAFDHPPRVMVAPAVKTKASPVLPMTQLPDGWAATGAMTAFPQQFPHHALTDAAPATAPFVAAAPFVATRTFAPAHTPHVAASRRPQRDRNSGALSVVVGAIALIAAVVLAVPMLFPRHGQIRVAVAAEDGEPIVDAKVEVDGVVRCTIAPCVITEVGAGEHRIDVVAAGFERPESVTTFVDGGREKSAMVFMRRQR